MAAPRDGPQLPGDDRSGSAREHVQVQVGGVGGGVAVAAQLEAGGSHVPDLHTAVRLRLDGARPAAAVALRLSGPGPGHDHEQVEGPPDAVHQLHPALRVQLAATLLSHRHGHPLFAGQVPGEVLSHLRRAIQSLGTAQSRGAMDTVLHLIRSLPSLSIIYYVVVMIIFLIRGWLSFRTL